MPWIDYAKVFLLGLAGSGHCVGMCSAFALAISVGSRNKRQLIVRHLAYHLGKAASYAFIGVLLLLAAAWAAEFAPFAKIQRGIAITAGILMMFAGVLMLAERRIPVSLQRLWYGSAACQAMSSLWSSASAFKSILIGWVNGFLPCGLSFMALLFLASTGSVGGTVAGAFVFTLGTFPALLAVGLLGQRMGLAPRRWMVRLSGVLLIVFGVLTVVRDRPAVHHWFHEHLVPTLTPGGHQHDM
jgi:uncharacterized protein